MTNNDRTDFVEFCHKIAILCETETLLKSIQCLSVLSILERHCRSRLQQCVRFLPTKPTPTFTFFRPAKRPKVLLCKEDCDLTGQNFLSLRPPCALRFSKFHLNNFNYRVHSAPLCYSLQFFPNDVLRAYADFKRVFQASSL